MLPKPPEACGWLIRHTEWFSISHCSLLSLLYLLKAWHAASIALPWKLANTLCYFNKHRELAQCLAAGSLDLAVAADLLPTLSQSSLLPPPLQYQKVKIPSLLPPTTDFPDCCQTPFVPGLGANWWCVFMCGMCAYVFWAGRCWGVGGQKEKAVWMIINAKAVKLFRPWYKKYNLLCGLRIDE